MSTRFGLDLSLRVPLCLGLTFYGLAGCTDDGTGSSSSDATSTSGSETTDSMSTETSASTSVTGDGDGDPATGDGDGDMTTTSGDGDGDETTTSGDGDGDGMTGDGDGDGMGGDGDGDGLELPLWLLNIDNLGETHRLVRLSLAEGEEGQTDVICDDLTLPPGIPANTSFNSLTFNANLLLASMRDQITGDTLALIDPCTCEVSEIGKYGFERVNGITSNEDQLMFGTSNAQDAMIQIDPMTAMSMQIQDLGEWGSGGLTWSEPQENVLYAINSADDRLYTFDGDDASPLGDIPLSQTFGSVGMELHPTLGVIYACGVNNDPSSLHSINIETGDVEFVATTDLDANCSNLAAPFGPVDCVPQ